MSADHGPSMFMRSSATPNTISPNTRPWTMPPVDSTEVQACGSRIHLRNRRTPGADLSMTKLSPGRWGVDAVVPEKEIVSESIS